jgi:hypothetical protein
VQPQPHIEDARPLFEAHQKQADVIQAIFSRQYTRVLYGGAMGGGKTYLICALLILLARLYPGSRWAIIRETHTKIKRNVLGTWNKVAPKDFCGPVVDMKVKCTNGSVIEFVAVYEKEDPDLNVLRGLELDGAVVDEANEISKKAYDFLGTRVGRWTSKYAVKQPPAFVLCTCNPTKEWPKEVFYDSWAEGSLSPPLLYVPAKIYDNPHIPQANLDGLALLPDDIRYAMVEGNWDYADDPTQMIKSRWIIDATKRPSKGGNDIKLGVDVATSPRGDEQVIANMRGHRLWRIDGERGIPIPETARRLATRVQQERIRPSNITIDVIGLGVGVAQGMRENYSMSPSAFIGNATAVTKDKYFNFFNRRSEGYWHLRRGFDPDDPDHWGLSFDPSLPSRHPEAYKKLTSDLIVPRYSMDSERTIRVEGKKEIKRRLGRSPDYSDALMMANAPTTDVMRWLNAMSQM